MVNDGICLGKPKEGCDFGKLEEWSEIFNIDSKERLNFMEEVLSRKLSDNKLLSEKLEAHKKTGYGVDFEAFKLFDVEYIKAEVKSDE